MSQNINTIQQLITWADNITQQNINTKPKPRCYTNTNSSEIIIVTYIPKQDLDTQLINNISKLNIS